MPSTCNAPGQHFPFFLRGKCVVIKFQQRLLLLAEMAENENNGQDILHSIENTELILDMTPSIPL